MAQFTLEHPLRSNFQISITSELEGVEGWNFQGLIISTLSTNSEKANKIWEVRVWTSKNIGWFDMELPRTLHNKWPTLVVNQHPERDTCGINNPKRKKIIFQHPRKH